MDCFMLHYSCDKNVFASDGIVQWRQKRTPKRGKVVLILSPLHNPCLAEDDFIIVKEVHNGGRK